MVLPLGKLLSNSVADYYALFRPILVGAIVFGLLLGFTSIQTQKGIAGHLGNLMNIEGEGIDPAHVEQLMMRVQQGDEAAMQELGEMSEGMENVAMPDVAGMVGSLFVFVVIMWVISFIGSIYYIVMAVDRSASPGYVFKRTVQMLVPMIGLSVWASVRSFVWIPIVGIIIGIVLMPRFILSPVLLLKEGRGIFESVSLSYARTSGYWGKIVGNSLIAAFCGVIVYLVLSMGLGVLGSVSPLVMAIAGSMLSQFFFAYISLFSIGLATTISNNPYASVGPSQGIPPVVDNEPQGGRSTEA